MSGLHVLAESYALGSAEIGMMASVFEAFLVLGIGLAVIVGVVAVACGDTDHASNVPGKQHARSAGELA